VLSDSSSNIWHLRQVLYADTESGFGHKNLLTCEHFEVSFLLMSQNTSSKFLPLHIHIGRYAGCYTIQEKLIICSGSGWRIGRTSQGAAHGGQEVDRRGN
jgi:hypothetical protein